MASRSELTFFQRGEIIGAWKCGLSEARIAAILGRAPGTIHNMGRAATKPDKVNIL